MKKLKQMLYLLIALTLTFEITSCDKVDTTPILKGISQLQNQNDSLLQLVIQLQTSLDSVQIRVNQNNTLLNTINTNISGLQNSVTTLITNITSLKSKIDTANANISSIQQQVTTLAKQYTSLSTQISNVFSSLSNQIDSLSIQTLSNSATLNALQNDYLTTQIKVDSILLQIQINNQLLTTNNANVALIQNQLIALTNEYNNVITLLNQLIALFNNQSVITSLTNGLIAYYPFAGNVIDSSGNGYNGTVIGNITYTNDRFNNSNKAAVLGSGYITTSNSFFDFQYINSFSISCWFTIAGNGSGGRLVSTENPEGNFRISSFGNGVYAVQFGNVYLYDTIPLNTWTHLIYTCQNQIGTIYKNGILKEQAATSNEALNYGTSFTIGAKAAPAYDEWIGSISSLRIYNRVLNNAEIQYLYTH